MTMIMRAMMLIMLRMATIWTTAPPLIDADDDNAGNGTDDADHYGAPADNDDDAAQEGADHKH